MSEQVKNDFADFVVPSIRSKSLSTVVQVSPAIEMYVVLHATGL